MVSFITLVLASFTGSLYSVAYLNLVDCCLKPRTYENEKETLLNDKEKLLNEREQLLQERERLLQEREGRF